MTPFRKFCLFAGLLTYLFASVAYGDEEIYSYIDKDGTLVFTNIKPAHLKPTKEKKRLNTFSWTDELGVLRKVHRVNVTSYDREILEAAKYYTLPLNWSKLWLQSNHRSSQPLSRPPVPKASCS